MLRSSRLTRSTLRLLVLAVVLAVVTAVLTDAQAQGRPIRSGPPRASGYFRTRPVGAWRSLPGDARCAARVHRSTWEPRPDNYVPNHRMPNRAAVRASLAARPFTGAATNHKWDTWLIPRVTGHYTGTTDEIFQWAACKWGISDNLLRAIAVMESTWYQGLVFPSGRCVTDWGCGDFVQSETPATDVFCAGISTYGHDYQADYGKGLCPETFSIAGVMSWQDPDWGPMPGNQNGTFPFNRDFTAFAVDYLGANLRGCLEGWQGWAMSNGSGYHAGDLWGCVGMWYAGEWRSAPALQYMAGVRHELRNLTWLDPSWPDNIQACSPTYGCPRGMWVGYSNY